MKINSKQKEVELNGNRLLGNLIKEKMKSKN